MTVDRLQGLLDDVAGSRRELATHVLYGRLVDLGAVRVFLEHHVFAVWDFMSLLKSLQRSLTCVDLPWRPVGNAVTRRLINEIVLEEESDVIDGVPTGHFEFYLRAMEQAGADTRPIRHFLALIADGVDVATGLRLCGAPAGSCRFTEATFALLEGPPHAVVAAFTIGREDSIPAMFAGLRAALDANGPLALFSQYLTRHLELDGEDHGPKALQMLAELCGTDARRWAEAGEAAQAALAARLRFWDAIAAALAPAAEMAPSPFGASVPALPADAQLATA